MGQCMNSGPVLRDVKRRTEKRFGKLSGQRYHYLPKKLEDDYVLTNTCLGSGAYASVHVVVDRHTQSTYAMKNLSLALVPHEMKKQLQAECEVCLMMDHPHVVRLVDVYESKYDLQLVMEHLKGGELFDRVVSKDGYSDREASEAMYQMLLAVKYLHQNGIVHRDIKLENFVYESQTSNHLKLIDFGFSKMCGKDDAQMSESCGTLAYVAPEVLNRLYTKKCDVWSLGVIAFILVAGHMPFGAGGTSDLERMARIRNCNINFCGYEARWAGVSAEAKGFIQRLLVVDPALRAGVGEALADPWITKHNHTRMLGSHVDNGIVDAMLRFAQAPALRRACMFLAASFVEEDAMLRNAFLELDRDHDGKITISELEQALEEKGGFRQSAVEGAFEAIDLNETKEIDYSEFLAAMFLSPNLALDEKVLRNVFRRIDTDGSGVITHKKLVEAFPKELMDKVDLTPSRSLSCVEFVHYVGPDSPKSKKLVSRPTRKRGNDSESCCPIA